MRYLIDGYNLMYAGGLLGKKLGSERFRKVRTRFLNDLAATLGPVDAHQTTVVFDASNAPSEYAHVSTHKGVSVIYAVDDADADARIELLIAAHSSPRALTVVSSDRRLRTAAERRKAVALTAEAFWEKLDALKERQSRPQRPAIAPPPVDRPESSQISSEESAYWHREFAHLDEEPEIHKAFGADVVPLLTDAEIAELEREIDREMS